MQMTPSDDLSVAASLSEGRLPDAPLAMPRQNVEGPGLVALIARALRVPVQDRRGLEQ